MNAFENHCPGQANGLSAYYFTQAVQMLIATHCTIGNPDDYPEDSAKILNTSAIFDFIVIGGGSSGSVIANRLSENPKWKILLLESGNNPTFESDIPGFGLSLNGRQLDWKFNISSTNHSCLGMEDEVCSLFQGRVLGGTSTINKMHYFRGFPEDYNEWERFGNSEWNFENVLPYFKKSEKIDETFKIVSDSDYDALFEKAKQTAENDGKLNELSKIAAGKYHSKAGSLSVNHFAYDFYLSEVKKAIFSAAEILKVPHIGDVNRQTAGFVRALGTISEGNRGNTAKAFLRPIKNRENLFVLKNATVQEITLRQKTAVGVKFMYNNEIKMATAKKEIILSAGVINTPRLLLLSGIGPKEQLQKAGITLQHDLKGVGENLQTHVTFFGLPVALKKINKTVSHLQKIDAMYTFISRGTGHFGAVGMNDIVGFVTLNNSTVQYLHYLNHARDYYTFNELLISLRVKNSIRDQFSKAYANSAVLLICPTVLQPKSTGKIEVVSSNFKIPPRIHANILNDRRDVTTLLQGIKFGLEMTKTKPFEDLESEIVKLEIENCKNLVYNSEKYWECLIRHLTSSMHDAAGTCKMGPSEDSFAVVDSSLKVHGIKGLRVADSSVMPTIVRGSTSIAAVMIGEKVSDLIKKEWKSRKHEEL